MQTEQNVSKVQKWMRIEGIIGTHGLSKELEGIAILLMVRGHDEAEVLQAVENVRNNAGACDEAFRRVQELEQALEHAKGLLEQEDCLLSYSENHLLRLGQRDAFSEAELDKYSIELQSDDSEVDLATDGELAGEGFGKRY